VFGIQEFIELRKELHRNPELSGHEYMTAQRIESFIRKFEPVEVIKNLGGAGIAFVFAGKSNGKTILIRCDLDALPIEESNEFEYRSSVRGVSHKCGHDGHMAIVSGLAKMVSEKGLEKGRVILLFQPAEETGEGAEKVLSDEKFKKLTPDYAFALHNLPGFPTGNIILRNQHFASASKGMIVTLKGKTSHAAEPENGRSPAVAMAKIILELTELPNQQNFSDFTLITVIHAALGEIAFGTTPGYAEVRATLRSYRNDDMETLTEKAIRLVKNNAQAEDLEWEIDWTEEFPATVNDEDCFQIIKKATETIESKLKLIEKPFKWSEDFGHFTAKFNGALFGLGAGENHSQLHNPDYDFPDEIIETGIRIFYEIIKSCNNET
jgi:amidohydrolase